MSKYRSLRLARAAQRFRALANPCRLQLFVQLAERCRKGCCGRGVPQEARRCVGELARRVSVAPSTVSHHLAELRRAGLIRMERRGRFIECWADPGALEELRGWLDESGGGRRPRKGRSRPRKERRR